MMLLVMWHLYIRKNKQVFHVEWVSISSANEEWYFTFMQSLFFLRWNYMCLGIEPLFDLSIFIAVDKTIEYL
jgi:hypothetical protein